MTGKTKIENTVGYWLAFMCWRKPVYLFCKHWKKCIENLNARRNVFKDRSTRLAVFVKVHQEIYFITCVISSRRKLWR